jgi:hypothetical protein
LKTSSWRTPAVEVFSTRPYFPMRLVNQEEVEIRSESMKDISMYSIEFYY